MTIYERIAVENHDFSTNIIVFEPTSKHTRARNHNLISGNVSDQIACCVFTERG